MSELLKVGVSEEKSDEARTSFLVGAVAVSNMIKSTLGPRGMLKLLYTETGEPILSNDGATILKHIAPNGPSAKILIDSAKEHGEKEGDGTTTLTVLTGELLQEADRLIFKGAHPSKIIRSYRKAHEEAMRILREIGEKCRTEEEKLSLAKSTLSSKFSPVELESLAKLAVAVSEKATDIEMVNFVKIAEGEVSSSYVEEGILLECDIGPGQKTEMDSPRVLVVNTAMDTDKVKIFGAKASVTSPKELEELENAERKKMAKKVEEIAAHADIIINRQIIYDYPTQEFTKRGKISIERADFSGIEMVSKVLNAKVLSTFDNVQKEDVGECGRFERVKISNRVFSRFLGVPNKGACTVVVKGPSKEILEEAARSLVGAVKVLMNTSEEYVYGGGSAEAAVALRLKGETEGERAYGRALLEVTRTLAENAGHSPDGILDEIMRRHREGQHTYGVGIDEASCMREKNVRESLRLKEIIWTKASETAEMLLRCDGIIRHKPRERLRE